MNEESALCCRQDKRQKKAAEARTAKQQPAASQAGSADTINQQTSDAAPLQQEHEQLHGAAQEAADATQDFANAVGQEVSLCWSFLGWLEASDKFMQSLLGLYKSCKARCPTCYPDCASCFTWSSALSVGA